MALFKKKNKDQDAPQVQLTPQEARQKRVFDHYSATRDSKSIASAVRWKRRFAVILTCAVIVLLVLWFIAWLLTTIGDLVIDVDSTAAKQRIVISETSDFADPVLELSGKKINDVKAITYDWLPTDLDTASDGSHNGKNYLAYTFYVKNSGSSTATFDSTLTFAGIAKSADESLRVMIYKNGEPTIYAKPNMDGSPLEEIVNFEFVDKDTIMHDTITNLAPNETIKYTIVTWIEGNDPEGIDDIKGAYAKMKWTFEAPE